MDNIQTTIAEDGKVYNYEIKQVPCQYCDTLVKRTMGICRVATCINCREIAHAVANSKKFSRSRLIQNNPQVAQKVAKKLGIVI